MKTRKFTGRANITLHHGDCLEVMKEIEPESIDLVLTDPPYLNFLQEDWDRQWKSERHFLDWLSKIADEWNRVLKPNGSLYCFASPQMSAKVEVMLSEKFNILNHIVWVKSNARGQASCKEKLRAFFPQTERIIFAEKHNSDSFARGETSWDGKCEELRQFIFEPLRKYLADEWKRAGLKFAEANDACGVASVAGGHYFSKSQWALPTAEHYASLQRYANKAGGEFLRREYEDLRREYEDLRRPFFLTSEKPYSDVWNFKTEPPKPGRHPCKKPYNLIRHIVDVSSRPGGVVLDSFFGSGICAEACYDEGRDFIGIEKDEDYFSAACERLEKHTRQMQFDFGETEL